MRENLLVQADTAALARNLQALEAFRRVVAGHLAEMFLDSNATEVHTWARAIAQKLKRAGVDIDADIMLRLRDRTLGPDPDEPPF
ncbi:hypothetical protein ACFV9E_06470 [Streptomyces sp. NPDC059835]|uniref:hypothetical protein n=1 Tax=Streptomyces sp. NPDC059835 TaxID=3346967 RepID=UPI00364A4D90